MTTPGPLARDLRRRSAGGDAGYMLLVAVATASVCLMLALTVVAVAVRSNTAAGTDRNRSQAAAAAEGGIDTAVARLMGFDPATWTSASACQQALTTGTAQVALTYAFTSGATADPCPLSASSSYTTVTVTSRATQTTGSISRVHTVTADVVLRGGSPFSQRLFQEHPSPRTMPRITYNEADWAPVQVKKWTSSQPCQATTLNRTLPSDVGVSGAVVMDATGCSLSFSTLTLRLDGDVTIFAKEGQISSLNVVSADSKPHSLRIIVPAKPTGDVCTGGGGSLQLSSVSVASTISTFIYTPGAVQASSVSAITGAVYACTLQVSSMGTLTYSTTPLPPVPSGGPYTVTAVTKADVLG